MKTSKLRLPALILSALALHGCTTVLESKKIDYKTASKLPTLEVPPDLTTPTRDERYVVPGAGKSSATYSSYSDGRNTPAASEATVLPQSTKVKLERDGNQRWLVVNATPEVLWPQLQAFWQSVGFSLAVDMPKAGVMETEWNENRARLPQDIIRNSLGKALDFLYSTSERDKFRTRLESGRTPGVTEIYISHRGMMEIYATEGKDETRWQPRPVDPELEAEMLQRLMVRLGADETLAQNQLAAPASEPARARLSADGNQLLVLESYDRTWRRVGLALDRIDFTVEDRDRTTGTYYVRYADSDAANPAASKDWLDRLKFWKSNKVDANTATRLRVHVAADQEQSRISVLTREGGADNSESARKILKLLLDQLK